jgi:hypothetical protein
LGSRLRRRRFGGCAPFDSTTATKPFEAGSEWTMEMHKSVIAKYT